MSDAKPDTLSERERKRIAQEVENAYYGRDIEALMRLIRALLEKIRWP